MFSSNPGEEEGKHNGFNRREFMQYSVLGTVGVATVVDENRGQIAGIAGDSNANSCILIMNVGGPSHLDTLDPKPDAPREVRSPFRPITVKGGGFQVSELLPGHARIGDKFAVVRGVYHTAPPIHDLGHQLVQTGYLRDVYEAPHVGCSIGYLLGGRGDLPPHVILPRAIERTGGNLSHGQDAGILGGKHAPVLLDGSNGCSTSRSSHSARRLHEVLSAQSEHSSVKERYGASQFGESFLQARRLVERGVRFVTVNSFSTVFGTTTWDIHGDSPFSTMCDMSGYVAPAYDRAFAALIEDLEERGLLKSTLVVTLAEFGRTPKFNPNGGRDHWPYCWAITFAGCGIQGGQVIGGSDRIGAYPDGQGFNPQEVLATIFHALGIHGSFRMPFWKLAAKAAFPASTRPIPGLFRK